MSSARSLAVALAWSAAAAWSPAAAQEDALHALQHSVLDSVYVAGSGARVGARIELQGPRGRYIVSDQAGAFVGQLEGIEYRSSFRDQYGRRGPAVVGSWRVGGQTGFFVFRAPGDDGVLNGYWGDVDNRGRQRSIGSWDAKLVSYLQPPTVTVSAAPLIAPPRSSNAPSPTPSALKGEQIVGKNDMLKVSFLDDGVRAAKGVGRVLFAKSYVQAVPGGVPYDPQRGSSRGTCFLIGERLVLTAFHVIDSPGILDSLAVEFDDRPFGEGEHFEFDGPPLATSPQPKSTSEVDQGRLDYALLRINKTPAGIVPIKLGKHPVVNGQIVSIVHYPGDTIFRHVTLHSSVVLDAPDKSRYLLYSSDTLQGSSGAPVFNRGWELLALHSSELGPPPQDVPSQTANFGIRADAILSDLHSQLAGQPQLLEEIASQP